MVVIGLGNPGARYRGTRHNVGFWVVDYIAQKKDAPPWKRGPRSRVTRVGDVFLVKPSTYMNQSGDAVSEICRVLLVPASHLLVVLDDMDLETGRIRIRKRGSSGGHRGMQSIIDRLGTSEIARIRLGIGRPPEGMDPADYVLRRPSGEERRCLLEAIDVAALAVDVIVQEGIDAAMTRFNGASP